MQNMYSRHPPSASICTTRTTYIILRRPLRTDADTDADPRGEVFGPRYDLNMLTLVGVYQYIHHIHIWGFPKMGHPKTMGFNTKVI